MIVKHKQHGSADCGVFAIAYAVEVALGTDPKEVINIKYNQQAMRTHLAAAFDAGQFTRFPREEETRLNSGTAAPRERSRQRKGPKKDARGRHAHASSRAGGGKPGRKTAANEKRRRRSKVGSMHEAYDDQRNVGGGQC
jgi:hypothetical protein